LPTGKDPFVKKGSRKRNFLLGPETLIATHRGSARRGSESDVWKCTMAARALSWRWSEIRRPKHIRLKNLERG